MVIPRIHSTGIEPAFAAKDGIKMKNKRLVVFVYASAEGGLALGYFLGTFFGRPVIEAMIVMNLLGIGAGFILEEIVQSLK